MKPGLRNTPQGANPPVHDPYAALRFRDFRLLLIGQFTASLGNQMLSVAIGWELWLRTRSELALGFVGLVQVIPIILLSLPAGHVADNYNRKKIVIFSQVLLVASSIGLGFLSLTEGPILLIYLCLLGIGISRAYNGPAASTLLPQTVPSSIFTQAVTWNSSSWQLASIVGPALAGGAAALLNSVTSIYFFNAAAAVIFMVMVMLMKSQPLTAVTAHKAATLESLKDGLRFIRDTKEVLAAITLDMFAVLLGGAVTLLPVYATDILKVGAVGLGIMRAAPSIGAIATAFVMAHLPPIKQGGKLLFWAVAGFGTATIFFGLSNIFWFSVLMLIVLGGLDNISVVIRGTLILVRTPDEMLGRSSAVNNIFIGASNELGGFESGATAALFGPVLSVVGGGIGTILVVLAVAGLWPELRNLKTLDVTSKE